MLFSYDFSALSIVYLPLIVNKVSY